MKLTPQSVTVPFSGFYQSLHDASIDGAIEQMFSDRATGTERNEGLEQRLFDKCDFSQVHNSYAKAYTEAFAQAFGLETLKFEKLVSPKEYNFDTDRIFAFIDGAELERLYQKMERQALAELVNEKFTSGPGFHSFYSNDLADWGPVSTWDHNQAGTLLEALADQESMRGDFDSSAEFGLCEDFSGKGWLESWLYEATQGIKRLDKVYEYLQDREARKGEA